MQSRGWTWESCRRYANIVSFDQIDPFVEIRQLGEYMVRNWEGANSNAYCLKIESCTEVGLRIKLVQMSKIRCMAGS